MRHKFTFLIVCFGMGLFFCVAGCSQNNDAANVNAAPPAPADAKPATPATSKVRNGAAPAAEATQTTAAPMAAPK